MFRCVSRNFCDNNGMVTQTRHNNLVFETDRRGFIVSHNTKHDRCVEVLCQACVDSGRNVLGVCCVELTTVLAGEGRPVRQDDVFTVRMSVVDPMLVIDLHCLCVRLRQQWTWRPWTRRQTRAAPS